MHTDDWLYRLPSGWYLPCNIVSASCHLFYNSLSNGIFYKISMCYKIYASLHILSCGCKYACVPQPSNEVCISVYSSIYY